MSVSHRVSIAALCLTVALPAAATAQTGDPVDSVLACRSVTELEARLACFDAAADRLAAARQSGDLMTVTRGDVEAVERDSFGYSLPSLPRLRLPSIAAILPSNSGSHDALPSATSTPAPASAPAAAPTQMADAGLTPTQAPTQAPAPVQAPTAAATQSPAPARPAEPEDEAGAVAVLERSNDGGVFRVSMEIERFRQVGYQTTLFYMVNGQVWRQYDDTRVRPPRGDGHVAEIRRAAMDSYLLRINGEGRAIRVRRVE